jgi:hypothetical protein
MIEKTERWNVECSKKDMNKNKIEWDCFEEEINVFHSDETEKRFIEKEIDKKNELTEKPE